MSIIYIPTDAKNRKDIEISLKFVSLLKKKGYKSGLMIIIKGGTSGLVGESRTLQIKNIRAMVAKKTPMIVMCPNQPFNEYNFVKFPEKSIQHIIKATNFAKELSFVSNKIIVTFHLNTLFSKAEWSDAGESTKAKFDHFNQLFFNTVLPSLKKLYNKIKNTGIELKIENTPTPEFGDSQNKSLNSISNPFPLYSQRGFKEIKSLNINMVLDLCHMHTLFKASKEMGGNNFFDIYKGVFPSDINYLKTSSIFDEVKALDDNDLIHLNDSLGIFDPKNKKTHTEGVALGDGDIKELKKIVKLIKNKSLNFVFEINEHDYTKRSNLKKSIDYFLNI